MKKLAIVGASAALAALPLMGVFAADGDVTGVTDNITVTVSPTCTLGTAAKEKQVSTSLTNGGHKDDLEGSTFTIACNDAGGWNLKAAGDTDGDSKNVLKGSSSGTNISTGTTIDGSASAWAFKATGSGVLEDYSTNFAAIPASATKIAGGSSPVHDNSVTITYGVSVGMDQPADTYEGKVVYTLGQGAGK